MSKTPNYFRGKNDVGAFARKDQRGVVIADNEACAVVLNVPRWRKAAVRLVNYAGHLCGDERGDQSGEAGTARVRRNLILANPNSPFMVGGPREVWQSPARLCLRSSFQPLGGNT